MLLLVGSQTSRAPKVKISSGGGSRNYAYVFIVVRSIEIIRGRAIWDIDLFSRRRRKMLNLRESPEFSFYWYFP